MDDKTYMGESARTVSDQFHAELLKPADVIAALTAAKDAGQLADAVKRTLFYGAPLRLELWGQPGYFDGLAASLDNVDYDVIHAILGKISEAAELGEALIDALMGREPLDTTNLVEEVGDGWWYDALLLRAINAEPGDVRRRNIEKLRARFPQKFTEGAAVSRDLVKENAALTS